MQLAGRDILAARFQDGFSFGLFVNPEEVGGISFRNIGWLTTDGTFL
jgi:hypothetical protein